MGTSIQKVWNSPPIGALTIKEYLTPLTPVASFSGLHPAIGEVKILSTTFLYTLDVTHVRKDTRPSTFFVQLKQDRPGNEAIIPEGRQLIASKTTRTKYIRMLFYHDTCR